MSQLETKQKVRLALESNDFDAIVSMVRQQKRTLSLLVRLAYDKDTLAGWRAIKAVGLAAKALVQTDDEYLRSTMRKLLWSLSDESGGIGWSAPELLGEMVSADPGKFSDIIPLIAEVYTIEEDVFRAGVLYALSRIAATAPERVVCYMQIIMLSLTDKDPRVRVNGLELVDMLWKFACDRNLWKEDYRSELANAINMLKIDNKVVWTYMGDGFIDEQVGEKATKVIKKIST